MLALIMSHGVSDPGNWNTLWPTILLILEVVASFNMRMDFSEHYREGQT